MKRCCLIWRARQNFTRSRWVGLCSLAQNCLLYFCYIFFIVVLWNFERAVWNCSVKLAFLPVLSNSGRQVNFSQKNSEILSLYFTTTVSYNDSQTQGVTIFGEYVNRSIIWRHSTFFSELHIFNSNCRQTKGA